MAQENPERHYNIALLNKIFALASLILLIALIWIFADDYAREWKGYQRDFRALESEKTQVKYNLESNRLKSEGQYDELDQKIKEAQKEAQQHNAKIKQLEDESAQIQSQYDIYNQQFQFVRAKYDSTKYYYEESSHKKSADSVGYKQKLDQLERKLSELSGLVEDSKDKLTQKQSQINDLQANLRALQKEEKTLTKQLDIFQKKLGKVDLGAMTFANQVADMIRDFPVIDLANPNFRIQQVVLHDIKDNVNFMQVPKVDRCTTCHLGISNPDFKDAPQPFRTHPDLKLFVDNHSAHPLEEFGCTTCHGGRGRGTDFLSAMHTPSSEEQKKGWEKKYHWHKDPHWENPMYPKQYVQAGCFKCHSGENSLRGAEKLNLGLNLIERAGCYSCHTIEKYKDWVKPGPDLTKLSSKISQEWTYQWIANPKSFRHNTWMPSFFGQSNNTDPESLKRSEQEIHAIVSYLFAKSASFNLETMPVTGDAKKGEELVASLGCLGCHNVLPKPTDDKRSLQSLRREQGPNLIDLGTKTSQQWLYSWLKDPSRYHPETKMPNLRLSDQEAADIATYLAVDNSSAFNKNSIPKVNEAILNKIVEEFLTKSESVEKAKSQSAQMDLNKKLLFAGEKLIRHYGCFSCHNIDGFDNEKPIGTDLTEEGDKAAERLDFGFVPIEHTKEAWFFQKLKNPRIFDEGHLKDPLDKLRMPNFNFSDDEAEAITTALLSFVKERPAPAKWKPRTPRNLSIEEGETLIREFNCQGCHLIENDGGQIRSSVTEWLVKYQGRPENEAQAMTTSFSPPNLIGEGKKVQTKWLFDFLHHPETIRPWLSVRMPTYNFSVAELNGLIKYFNALDNEDFPFSDLSNYDMSPEEYSAAQKLFSDDYFGCAKCHIVGNQMPGGSPDSWAPNFALAKRRLKPKWIIEWLHNPQDLLPGTKMPTYFDPQNFDTSGPEDLLNGDENEQIRALRDYLLTISDHDDKSTRPENLPQQEKPQTSADTQTGENSTGTPPSNTDSEQK